MMRLMETHPTTQIWKFVSHNAGNTNSTPPHSQEVVELLTAATEKPKMLQKSACTTQERNATRADTQSRATFPCADAQILVQLTSWEYQSPQQIEKYMITSNCC
jgi:hypothetical protein